MTDNSNTPHPKPTQAEDGELLMLLENYKEDIKYLHHQIKDKDLTPDEILAKEDVLTNQSNAKILSLKSTWQAEARQEMLKKLPEHDRYKLSPIQRKPYMIGNTLSNRYAADDKNEGWNEAIDLMRERLEQ